MAWQRSHPGCDRARRECRRGLAWSYWTVIYACSCATRIAGVATLRRPALSNGAHVFSSLPRQTTISTTPAVLAALVCVSLLFAAPTEGQSPGGAARCCPTARQGSVRAGRITGSAPAIDGRLD